MVLLHNLRNNNFNVSEDVIINRIQSPLTNSDIERLFPEIGGTIKYNEIKNYNDIDELLPEDKCFKVILIEQDNNVGHWVCISKYDNTIEYFNPYGTKVDNDKRWIGKLKNMLLGQCEDVLSELMEKSKYKCVYSKTKFQKISNKLDIQTCGRWCCLRLICLRDLDMDLNKFKKFIKDNTKATGLPKDALVCVYIS
jgi:hypothetical protein